MQYVEETNRVRVAGEYDVVVAGGGVAGIAAALAARRAGKRALLIEKSLKLGGLATLGLINLFVPMCNGRGTPIIGGMCEELLRLSIRLGYDSLPEAWRECGVHPGEQSRYVTRFSPDIFAMELSRLLDDEGVDILYDALHRRNHRKQERPRVLRRGRSHRRNWRRGPAGARGRAHQAGRQLLHLHWPRDRPRALQKGHRNRQRR